MFMFGAGADAEVLDSLRELDCDFRRGNLCIFAAYTRPLALLSLQARFDGAKRGRLLKSYNLQHAEVGVVADYLKYVPCLCHKVEAMI